MKAGRKISPEFIATCYISDFKNNQEILAALDLMLTDPKYNGLERWKQKIRKKAANLLNDKQGKHLCTAGTNTMRTFLDACDEEQANVNTGPTESTLFAATHSHIHALSKKLTREDFAETRSNEGPA